MHLSWHHLNIFAAILAKQEEFLRWWLQKNNLSRPINPTNNPSPGAIRLNIRSKPTRQWIETRYQRRRSSNRVRIWTADGDFSVGGLGIEPVQPGLHRDHNLLRDARLSVVVEPTFLLSFASKHFYLCLCVFWCHLVPIMTSLIGFLHPGPRIPAFEYGVSAFKRLCRLWWTIFTIKRSWEENTKKWHASHPKWDKSAIFFLDRPYFHSLKLWPREL